MQLRELAPQRYTELSEKEEESCGASRENRGKKEEEGAKGRS